MRLLLLFTVGLAAVTAKITYDPADDSWAKWEDLDAFDSSTTGATPTPQQPNIIFTFVDDAGNNDVGFKNPDFITPNIDELAYGGLQLDQNYVTYYCTPSRASLMTGMDPYHIGRQKFVFRPSSLGGLTRDYRLLPEYLKDLGYTNHIVGKWHLGHCNEAYTPQGRGFDTSYGPMASGVWNWPKLNYFYPYLYDWFANGTISYGEDVGLPSIDFQMDLYRDRAVEVIRNNAAAGGPFFMYLAFTSTHFPIEAPPEFLDLYPGIDDSIKRRSFMAMTSQLDAMVGDIVNALKETGQYDNTIMVHTPDNGAYSYKWDWIPFHGGGDNWPLRGQKGTNYEGGTRVPAFVHYPPMATAGQVTNKMIHVTDWLPTLLRAAGADLDSYPEIADLDGIDQYDVIFDGAEAKRNAFAYNILQLDIPDGSGGSFEFDMGAVRYGKWKILNFNETEPLMPIGSWELYDLSVDPEEANNVFDSEPDVAAKMIEKFQQAASSKVPIDPTGYLPVDQLKLISTNLGEQRIDFCDLDANPVAVL